MKKYRLLKDTVKAKKGTIYVLSEDKDFEDDCYYPEGKGRDYYYPEEEGEDYYIPDYNCFDASLVENNPEWFEEVKEDENEFVFVINFYGIDKIKTKFFREEEIKWLKYINNWFDTEEDEKEREKRIAIYKVNEYIKDNFGVFKPDWDDNKQEKWCFILMFDYENKEKKSVEVFNSKIIKIYSPIGYLKTEEQALEIKEKLAKELKLILGD